VKVQIEKKGDGASVLRCVRKDGSVTYQKHQGRQGAFFPIHDLAHFAVESEVPRHARFYSLIAPGWNNRIEEADISVRLPGEVTGAQCSVGYGVGAACRNLVVSGDTAPCEMARVAAHEAELLVHDGSFADQEAERASETGHSTARQAAELARDAGAAMLALVHISSRYDVREVLAEAREAFPATEAPRDFDLVEVPLPERGPPRLIEDGARASTPA